MKEGRMYISKDEFLKIAAECGCTVELQAGFHKVTKAGAPGIIYVSKSSSCGRIDISNTLVEGHDDEVENLGSNHYGKVHQRVNFGGIATNGQRLPDRSREQILEFFRWLCTELPNLPPLPTKERARPVGLKGSKRKAEPIEVKVTSELTPQQQIDELLKKRRLMKEAGERYGVPPNQKMMVSIAEKLAALGHTETDGVQA